MEHSTGGYNKVTKTGKRISLDDLYAFIKKNKQAFKDVGCVDLNDTKDTTVYTSLEKLHFQDFRKVNYLPKNLANIFKLHSADFGKYIHVGTLKTINLKRQDVANLQISLYSSIMTCLKQSFLSLPVSTQVDFISKLVDRLQNESKGSKYEEFCYARKYRWKKSDISNDITHSLSGGNIIKYLSDYFHINIFILDVDKDELYFGSDEYVPYKKSIFLLKYADETFEPFFTEQTKTFSVTDKIIERIRSKSKDVNVYVLCDNMDFKFQEVEEDLDWYSQKPGFNKRDFLAQRQKKLDEKHEGSDNESVCSVKSNEVKKKTTNSNKKHTDDNYDESMNNFDDGYDYEADANEMDVKSDNLGDMWRLTNLSEESGSDEFMEKTKSKTLKNKTIALSSESESSDESIKPTKKKQPIAKLSASSSTPKTKSKKELSKSKEESSNSDISSSSEEEKENTKKKVKVSDSSDNDSSNDSSDDSSDGIELQSSDSSNESEESDKAKPQKKNKKVSTKSSSEEKPIKNTKKVNKYTSTDIKATLKLDELQTIAKSLKITTIDNKSKKNKTKAVLIKEIKSKLDK